MSDPRIERRIFVVGVPRSGTTLVQSLLAAHSQLTSFTESHFFSRHFRPLIGSRAILRHHPAERVEAFLRENAADLEQISAARAISESSRLVSPGGTSSMARRLIEVLDQMASVRGYSSWIEKTPRHLRLVPFLERVGGDTATQHYIHVIREGLEVVASLHKASQSWERPYDLETCVERWNADVAFSLKRLESSSPNDHLVFYEELTDHPEATLERLFAALGLSWEPEALERRASATQGLITREETWKKGSDRGLQRSGTSHQVLTREQRAQAKESLDNDLYNRLRELAR